MGNKRIRRFRRLDTPSREKEIINTQVETPNAGNETSTNYNVIVQESLGDGNSENQLTATSLISNEIQVRTQTFEQFSNDRITTRRDRLKSAPYLRLKNIQGTTIGNICKKIFFFKKIVSENFFRIKCFFKWHNTEKLKNRPFRLIKRFYKPKTSKKNARGTL